MVDCKTLIFMNQRDGFSATFVEKKKKKETHSRPQMTGFWFHMAQMRKQTRILGLDEIRENKCQVRSNEIKPWDLFGEQCQ